PRGGDRRAAPRRLCGGGARDRSLQLPGQRRGLHRSCTGAGRRGPRGRAAALRGRLSGRPNRLLLSAARPSPARSGRVRGGAARRSAAGPGAGRCAGRAAPTAPPRGRPPRPPPSPPRSRPPARRPPAPPPPPPPSPPRPAPPPCPAPPPPLAPAALPPPFSPS